MLLHLSAVSAASVRSSAIFREACGWILTGRRTSGFACWFKDIQYIAINKKIRMTAETSIRLAPQVDFITAVMTGEHAAATCFDGGHSCTCWLLLHGQCVLVSPHPIRNFVILTVPCREMRVSQNYIGVEPRIRLSESWQRTKVDRSSFWKKIADRLYIARSKNKLQGLTSSITQIVNLNYAISSLEIRKWTNELRTRT